MNMSTELPPTAVFADAGLGPKPHIVEELNKVLRGEISAVEAYTQIIHRFAEDPTVATLADLKRDHEENATYLRDMLDQEGAVPADTSGAWGTVVKTVMTAGQLLGEGAAISALKQGEEHGLKLYKELLSENLSAIDSRLIKDKIIPRQESHISVLNRISSPARH
jgi:hypothetical protein